jgi:hypothetical protein
MYVGLCSLYLCVLRVTKLLLLVQFLVDISNYKDLTSKRTSRFERGSCRLFSLLRKERKINKTRHLERTKKKKGNLVIIMINKNINVLPCIA